MNAKILSLNVDKSVSFSRFKARIESSIKAYSENLKFDEFEDIRELFVALQDAFETEDIIITAVDIKNYLRFKNALIQAFDVDVVYNPTVLNKIEIACMDDKKKMVMSAFPEPATVFITDDGMYSGFGMDNGSQYLILLPIDNNRIDSVLRKGVVPFLDSHIMPGDIPNDYYEEKSVNNEKVLKAVEQLKSSGSVVAVNGTKNAEVLKSCGDYVIGFNDVFVFTPHVEDKGNVNVTEYAAQLAKVSLDLSSANIGACISDIYSSGDVKYLCIAVAGDESAVVRKLYMSENESESSFVESAALELIELVGEKASGKRSIGIEISEENEENLITDDDKKSVGKKPLAILAVILGFAIVIAAVIGIVFHSQGSGSEFSGIFSSLFSKEEQTTDPTTTNPPAINKPAEPDVDKSLLKISDFIVSEFLKMSSSDIAAKSVITDHLAPDIITVNGEEIDAREALARLVTAELGSGFRTDVVKAQTVAIYTFLKFNGNNYTISGVQISSTYNDVVKDAVDEVFGEYLTYNGGLALAPYHLASAKSTFDVSNIIPYLKSVTLQDNPDVSVNDYHHTKEYSSSALRNIILRKNPDISLDSDPSKWITVKSHNEIISEDIGYVNSVIVGGVEMTGVEFRLNVMGIDELDSVCFDISYDAEKDLFSVETFGKGHGVGMSQTAANYMAVKGADYKKILETFFEGTVIAKEDNA